ncbi:MAG: HEPN domain-containing protein [Actinobacteria bacterium]|nr:HEPN domain-containing protein [Actinomycetota bacterium]MDI6830577.1 hypothetical protein [Actinomycetota bacterium]
MLERGKEPDEHYIPTRYPIAYPQGAPFEYCTRSEAERAIENGESGISLCEDKIS